MNKTVVDMGKNLGALTPGVLPVTKLETIPLEEVKKKLNSAIAAAGKHYLGEIPPPKHGLHFKINDKLIPAWEPVSQYLEQVKIAEQEKRLQEQAIGEAFFNQGPPTPVVTTSTGSVPSDLKYEDVFKMYEQVMAGAPPEMGKPFEFDFTLVPADLETKEQIKDKIIASILQAGVITTSKIADGAVALSKLGDALKGIDPPFSVESIAPPLPPPPPPPEEPRIRLVNIWEDYEDAPISTPEACLL